MYANDFIFYCTSRFFHDSFNILKPFFAIFIVFHIHKLDVSDVLKCTYLSWSRGDVVQLVSDVNYELNAKIGTLLLTLLCIAVDIIAVFTLSDVPDNMNFLFLQGKFETSKFGYQSILYPLLVDDVSF